MLGMLLTPELPSKPGDHLEVASAADPGALYESTFRPIEALPFRLSEPVGGHSLLFNATVELLPPEITAISPKSGSSGTDVTITGRHLAVATAVTVGGIPAVGLFRGADDNQITAIVPRQAAGGTAAVQVTTAGGTAEVTPASLLTYSDPSTGPDTTPPSLSGLRVRPLRFRATRTGGPVIHRRAGALVEYRLSEAAAINFGVQRVTQGRLSATQCVPASHRNLSAPGCTLIGATLGSFRMSYEIEGSFNFSGRLAGRALPPGVYLLQAVASDAAGNRSKTATQSFRILP